MLPDVLSGPAGCHRLVCASSWSSERSPLDHLLAQRERLLRAATARGLRIALLHRAGCLVHWIEGPAGAVEAVWQRVQRTPELHAHQLLHRSDGAPSLQDAVHIATLYRSEAPAQVACELAQLAAWAARAEPLALWRALAAPGAAPAGGTVVVASAREHDGIDLLRRLAQRTAAPVAYQRFAGADLTQFDSGAAYADIPQPPCGCIARMQVLSRRSLALALVRQALPALHGVVLLLGSRTLAAERLAEGVRRWLEEGTQSVRLQLVAHSTGALHAADAILSPWLAATHRVARVAGTAAEDAVLLQDALADAAREAGPGCHARPPPLMLAA